MAAKIRYWDVFPKSIRGFRAAAGGSNSTFQLVLCGDPRGVVFESTDETVAAVNSAGVVTFGMKVGYATINAYEPAYPENVRKVEVQVLAVAGAAIQSIGAQNSPGADTGRYASEGHVHQGLTQFGTDVRTAGAVNLPGTKNEAARVDHVHRIVWLEYTGP